MTDATIAGPQVIIGLGIAIFVMIFLVLKTRVHALLALVTAASLAGLIGGMPANEVIGAITTGFGATLATIGLVIGFGVMMGRILEVSGAGQRLARTILRLLGKEREDWAMALTGYIVSIPIFCDSAYVILNPLVRALSRSSGRSLLTLGIALGSGLIVTHSAVPPTPGPLGVAGIFGIDIGLMIAWGDRVHRAGTDRHGAVCPLHGPTHRGHDRARYGPEPERRHGHDHGAGAAQ